MVQVVIQPAYGNPMARRHWALTLDQQVPFEEEHFRSGLTDSQFDSLIGLHPAGRTEFWGATPNHDKRMDTLQSGDVFLFTGQNRVRAVGEVGISFRNSVFANRMWAEDPKNGSFHNVYSLLNFQHVDIPYSEIWALPSFKTGDNFMGLRFLDAEKSTEILQGLRIESAVAAQQADQAELKVTEALASGKPLPTEAVRTTTTTYLKAATEVLVHRAEALLVQDYAATLNGVATSRFKTPDGGIADLLVATADTVEVIEAKRSSSRTYVRQALGQLLDYAPWAGQPVDRLTVLVPERPADSVVTYLHRYGVDCIFRATPGQYTRLEAPDEARAHLRERWLA
ncbi:hypothetical protein ACIGG9_27610 [Pseudonocardia alni]|uniref:hypothetical protein n=1 Tax=Pseudonocardia alni TaxID=33907 RepID=UPI0034029719